MSHRTLPTPTRWYCAASRCAGLGRYSGEIMPSEVESPMWVTAWHEVRSADAGVAALPDAAAPAAAEPCFAGPPGPEPPWAGPPGLEPPEPGTAAPELPWPEPLVPVPLFPEPEGGGGRTLPAARVPLAAL